MDIRYVLITPAKNEEAYIEDTIKSVVSQTVLPQKWIIVDDGSTDRTGEIAQHYAERYPFLDVLSTGGDSTRNFGSKVAAFQAGYAELGDIEYDFIGNLDADVTFGTDYFEQLFRKFEDDPELGLCGGLIVEKIGDEYVGQSISGNSVAGAVQLFRRRCYEAIGGYTPNAEGGIDSVAEIKARYHGYKVRTFFDLKVLHHRRVGTVNKRIFHLFFQHGVKNYTLGYHPFFHIAVGIKKVHKKPYILGSGLIIAGYVYAGLTGKNRAIPRDVIRFLRREQMNRLFHMFKLQNAQ